MARKVTDQVTVIDIDIGKNAFHLIGLDGRLGSKVPVSQGHRPRPNLGATRKSAGRFPTFVT